MNTINFELSKKLTVWWYLDNLEVVNKEPYFKPWTLEEILVKKMSLDEAIDFLPNKINDYYLVLWKNEFWYWWNYFKRDELELYILDDYLLKQTFWKQTFLEIIEKMLEYLLYNNLLSK